MRKPKDLTNLNAGYTEGNISSDPLEEKSYRGDGRRQDKPFRKNSSNISEGVQGKNKEHNNNKLQSSSSETVITEPHEENLKSEAENTNKKAQIKNKSQRIWTYILVLAVIIAYNFFFKEK